MVTETPQATERVTQTLLTTRPTMTSIPHSSPTHTQELGGFRSEYLIHPISEYLEYPP